MLIRRFTLTLKPELVCLKEYCAEFPACSFSSSILPKSVNYHLLDKEQNIVVKFSTNEARLCSKISIDALREIPRVVFTIRLISFLYYCCEDISLLPKWDKEKVCTDLPNILPMYIKVSRVPRENKIDIALPITIQSEGCACVQISINGTHLNVRDCKDDRRLQDVYKNVPSILSLLQLLKKRCDRAEFLKVMSTGVEELSRKDEQPTQNLKGSNLSEMFNSVIERFSSHAAPEDSSCDCEMEEPPDTKKQEDQFSEDEPMDMSMPRSSGSYEMESKVNVGAHSIQPVPSKILHVPCENKVTIIEPDLPDLCSQSSIVGVAYNEHMSTPQTPNIHLIETCEIKNDLVRKHEPQVPPQITNITEPIIDTPILGTEAAVPKRKGRKPKSEAMRQTTAKRESSNLQVGQLRSEKVDLLRLKITTCKEPPSVDPETAEPVKERKRPGRKRGSTTSQAARQQSSTIKSNATNTGGSGLGALFSDQLKDSSLSTFKIPRKKPQKPSVGLLPLPMTPVHSEGLSAFPIYPQQPCNSFRQVGTSSTISPQTTGFASAVPPVLNDLRHPVFPPINASTPVRRSARPRQFPPGGTRFRFG